MTEQRGDSPDGTEQWLRDAIRSAPDCSVGLVDLEDLTVASISPAWLARLGLPAESVIGRPAVDLVEGDKAAAVRALGSMQEGAINAYVARRELRGAAGVEPMTTVWVRSFEIGGRHLAFVQAAPAAEDTVSPISKSVGHDPITMAIGTFDADLVITAMSCDITNLLGIRPEDLVGHPLRSVVRGRDASTLLEPMDTEGPQAVASTVHMRNIEGDWVDLCLVHTSLIGNPDRCFILAPELGSEIPSPRVSELEHHLWSIAAIVEASGVLQRIGPMRDMSALPQANALTTRQWEILARIARGERVPTIAADLHLSQSTVRNHLSAIFKRFGVSSQPELLRVIDTAQAPAST